jgi:hypothetical protein
LQERGWLKVSWSARLTENGGGHSVPGRGVPDPSARPRGAAGAAATSVAAGLRVALALFAPCATHLGCFLARLCSQGAIGVTGADSPTHSRRSLQEPGPTLQCQQHSHGRRRCGQAPPRQTAPVTWQAALPRALCNVCGPWLLSVWPPGILLLRSPSHSLAAVKSPRARLVPRVTLQRHPTPSHPPNPPPQHHRFSSTESRRMSSCGSWWRSTAPRRGPRLRA